MSALGLKQEHKRVNLREEIRIRSRNIPLMAFDPVNLGGIVQRQPLTDLEILPFLVISLKIKALTSSSRVGIRRRGCHRLSQRFLLQSPPRYKRTVGSGP